MIFFLRAPNQPPSGGCVLKPRYATQGTDAHGPAAFGRLCVETANEFGFDLIQCPAAFGRLCVETIGAVVIGVAAATSRLRAAVC